MIMLIFFQKPYSNFNVNQFLKIIKLVFIPKSFIKTFQICEFTSRENKPKRLFYTQNRV